MHQAFAFLLLCRYSRSFLYVPVCERPASRIENEVHEFIDFTKFSIALVEVGDTIKLTIMRKIISSARQFRDSRLENPVSPTQID